MAFANPYHDGEAGLLRAILSMQGVGDEVQPEQLELFLQEFYTGYQAYLHNAMDHLGTLKVYDLTEPAGARPLPLPTAPSQPQPVLLSAAVESYLDEGRTSNQWVAKTLTSKVEDLKLLGELTGQMSPSTMTKADARAVKDKLFRLPKNRKKMPRTRNLSLADALKLTDVPTISTQTINGYISNYKSFFEWAVNNGYAKDNLFAGMFVRTSRRTAVERKAFTAQQLAVVFEYINDPSSLDSNIKCNTQRPWGIGCCDGQTVQAPQRRGTWRDFGGASARGESSSDRLVAGTQRLDDRSGTASGPSGERARPALLCAA
jgi:hypothetical protein